MRIFIAFFIGLLGLMSCHSNKTIETATTTKTDGFVLLDSIAAAQAIIIDKTDGFFEKVTPVDMAIQIKESLKENGDRTKLLSDYKLYLQQDVEDFTAEEKVLLTRVMQKAIRLCDSLSSKILPTTIQLIKTKGNHYGDGAFYTRDNCIIIPESDIKASKEKQLLQVMLHEISHIVTRYNPALREKLYNLIGFEKMLTNENLIISEPLKSILLANPDGMNMEYAMEVHKPNGELAWVLPLLYAGQRDFRPKSPSFFSYIKFQLFELKRQDDGRFLVNTDKGGKATLELSKLTDFFKKIGDNTQYIIHPDELIADNFWMMILATHEVDGVTMDRFSADGKVLILEVEKAVRGY